MASVIGFGGVMLLLSWLALVSCDSQLLNFTQRVDHMAPTNKSDLTFTQRLLVDDTRWGGAKKGAPIFVLFGGEDGQTFPPDIYGVLNQSANEFGAMLVHIEHRFYGDSIPLGSIESAMADQKVRGCLSTDQALQDFAEIIQSLKMNYSARNSPVIVVGIGYAGALATWFRLKYPEIAIGALASSTPLLFYGNSTPTSGYCSIVSKDFQDIDPICFEKIRRSWKQIDEIAVQHDGLAQLSRTFNTCKLLQSSEEIKGTLAQMYSFVAQFDEPGDLGIKSLCRQIDGEEDSIEYIAHGLHAKFKTRDCFQKVQDAVESPFKPSTSIAWEWQRCSELIFPVGCEENTMLPTRPFDFENFKKSCQLRFGISPNPHTPISFFKSKNVVESLTGFGGNIIFSNGLRDPFSSAGILDDLSETIVAFTTKKGTRCLDLTTPNINYVDTTWLMEQRENEVRIFRQWLNHYNHISGSYQHNSGSYRMNCNLIITTCVQILVVFIFIYLD